MFDLTVHVMGVSAGGLVYSRGIQTTYYYDLVGGAPVELLPRHQDTIRTAGLVTATADTVLSGFDINLVITPEPAEDTRWSATIFTKFRG